MKVSFPYMEPVIVYQKVLELLGHEVIVPPPPTRKTINLGVKYSPEFACIPLKYVLGTYMEAVEMGAETLVTSGGHGPCRAGYYGRVHDKIMEHLGKDVEIIVFDEPLKDLKKFYRNVKKIKGDKSWLDLMKAVYTAYQLSHAYDRIKRLVESKRAYAEDKVNLTLIWDKYRKRFGEIKTIDDIKKVEKEAQQEIEELDIEYPPEEDRIKIGVIGEIYVVMEDSVNHQIGELLNDLGAEVERSQYLSHYIDATLNPFGGKEEEKILEKGEEYIEIVIGGHAKQNVGHIIDYKERGFDGIVHLKPFGCLPELITQSMLDQISEDLDIPILSLSIDEQRASANKKTRVEAFLDLIKQKKFGRERMA